MKSGITIKNISGHSVIAHRFIKSWWVSIDGKRFGPQRTKREALEFARAIIRDSEAFKEVTNL